MVADPVQNNLNPFDIIDFESYSDGGTGKSYAPPVEGTYTGKAPVILDDGSDTISATNSFGRTNEGYLKLQLDPIVVVGGPANGYEVRFTRLSSKKFKNKEASQTLNFLRACGIDARPKSEAELRQALRMASNRTFQFSLIWEAYNKDADETYSGMDSFPVDPTDPTKRLPYRNDEYTPGKKWYANGKVKYFISALNKQ